MLPKKNLFALVDCNNFYVSCERFFSPKLEGKPVVVLSNNDGCIIARSEEAKQIGIKMGVPAFEITSLLEKNDVAIFSTNYALYGDLSQRVMSVLSQFTPSLEIYSIDEAFLDLSGLITNTTKYGTEIAKTVKQWVGIPVSIGIAPTKTLAKIANHVAKNEKLSTQVYDLNNEDKFNTVLESVPVLNIWGIGEAYAGFLYKHGINNANDLKNCNEKWIRKHLGVVGERTVFELRGVSCYPVDNNPQEKKDICFSRSYGKVLEKYDDIEQATTSFAVYAAEKMRHQKSVASAITVFVMTNRFAKGPQYVNGVTINMPVATNHTSEIIHYTVIALKKLYRKGYKYKKSGIIIKDLQPEGQLQCALWDEQDRERQQKITSIIDATNAKMGRGKLKYAIQGSKRSWKLRQEKLSPKYTTNWDELLDIKI